MSVFVVLPVFNEAKVVGQTVTDLLPLGHPIVAVDDGSTDDTWRVLGSLPIFSLRHPINLGQGAALQTGTAFALGRGAKIVVHFDADGQHRPEDISTLVGPIVRGEVDVALGSRFLRPSDRAQVPRARRWLLRMAVVVNGAMTGIWLTDAHNGLRALSAPAARLIQFRENRYAHASELLSQMREGNLRYQEVPVTVIYSAYSRAKGQSLGGALEVVIDLLFRRLLG